MRIVKGVTPYFPNYEVAYIVTRGVSRRFLGFQFGEDEVKAEHMIADVVEADDTTGLVVRHIRNRRGELLFTNGNDDIAISNTVKLLLLLPNIRAAFVESGFRPKLISSYEADIIIRYKGDSIPPPPPQVRHEPQEIEELETVNA